MCPSCRAESLRAEEEHRRAEEEHRRALEERQRAWEAGRQPRVINNLLKTAAIPPRYWDRTLDDFQAETDAQRKILQIVRAYVVSFEQRLAGGEGLVFCGKPGTGKTHLACAIAQQVCGTGRSARYAGALNVLRSIKATWRRECDESEDMVLWEYLQPDLLVLDELGAQFGTDSERLLLFDIINTRYEQLRPTILVSNLTERELGDCIGARAVDRMRESAGAVLAFTWDSYRPRVGKDIARVERDVKPVDWERLDR